MFLTFDYTNLKKFVKKWAKKAKKDGFKSMICPNICKIPILYVSK